MKDNRNTFPKLETGMVVRVKGRVSTTFGPYLVVGDKLMSADGWCELESFTCRGENTISSPTFDITAVYNGVGVYSLNLEEYLEELNPIWKLKEQCPTQAKIAELEETIKKASQQIQQLKEEMNV